MLNQIFSMYKQTLTLTKTKELIQNIVSTVPLPDVQHETFVSTHRFSNPIFFVCSMSFLDLAHKRRQFSCHRMKKFMFH